MLNFSFQVRTLKPISMAASSSAESTAAMAEAFKAFLRQYEKGSTSQSSSTNTSSHDHGSTSGTAGGGNADHHECSTADCDDDTATVPSSSQYTAEDYLSTGKGSAAKKTFCVSQHMGSILFY